MIGRFEQFCTAISSIQHSIAKIERVEMEKYGLKGPHAQCLLALSRYPQGMTATQLCELCEKDKAAISRIVAELEDVGLVERLERNGTRYRAALVLTADGQKAAQTVSRTAQLAVERAGEGLTDADREVFYRVLDQISENLHTICKDGL